MYALQISSISTAEPITVAELKTHLRIQTTAEDALLDLYITAARQLAENNTKRALVNTQWELAFDDFYSEVIELPRPPLDTHATEVVVQYTKTDETTTTLSDTAYTVEWRSEPGHIRLNYGREWPTDVLNRPGSVRITYRSGYTTSAAAHTCPEVIKQWIKMRAGQMYEYREPLISGQSIANLKRDFVDGLLDPYTVISI